MARRLFFSLLINQILPGVRCFATRPLGLATLRRPATPLCTAATSRRRFATKRRSVSGEVYSAEDKAPVVTLFTKEGCTLCDQVKDVLAGVRDEVPHALVAMDITDKDKREWWNRYKYDIPVLHVNGLYMAKHRITAKEAVTALAASAAGTFVPPQGEPNAAQFEVSEESTPTKPRKA